MGVSRSASKILRSSAGAAKASLTPSKSPMFNSVEVRGGGGVLGAIVTQPEAEWKTTATSVTTGNRVMIFERPVLK